MCICIVGLIVFMGSSHLDVPALSGTHWAVRCCSLVFDKYMALYRTDSLNGEKRSYFEEPLDPASRLCFFSLLFESNNCGEIRSQS